MRGHEEEGKKAGKKGKGRETKVERRKENGKKEWMCKKGTKKGRGRV